MAFEKRKRVWNIIYVVVIMMLYGGGGGGVDCLQFYAEYSTVIPGPPSSLFGYSVAFWQKRGASKVVVGAPKSKDSDLAGGNTMLGAIHVCDESELANCSILPDLPKNVKPECTECNNENLQFEGPQTFQNNTVGLGETLASNDKGDILIACAPRYPVFDKEDGGLQTRGACYIMASSIISVFPFTEHKCLKGKKIMADGSSAIRRTSNNNECSAYASFGFSAAFNKVSTKKVFIGAPNAFRREGATVTYSVSGRYSGPNKMEMMKERDYKSNLEGWAVSVGFFGKDDIRREESVAVTRPAHGNYTGENPPRKSPLVLHGDKPWGHYGISVACLQGRSSKDYTGVAVGAPGVTGRVYIYKGGDDGLQPHPTQILQASEFFPTVTASYGFGFSLAGGVDIDRNGLSDVLIGAPFSDAAILLRASPIIYLDAQVWFDPPEIDINEKKCEVGEQKTAVICSNLHIEIGFSSEVYGITEMLELDLELTVDLEEKRLAFFNEATGKWSHKTTNAINITRNMNENTLTVTVYGKPFPFDYETPVHVSVTGKLKVFPPPPSSVVPPPPPPAFSSSHPTTFNSTLHLLCERCNYRTDLSLHANGPEYLVIGERKLNLSVLITCLNDTAEDTTLEVSYPRALRFENSVSSESPHLCLPKEEEEEEEEGVSTLICSFTNFLKPEEKVKMEIVFTQNSDESLLLHSPEGNTAPVFFNLSVSSSTEDIDGTDNSYSVLVPTVSQIDLISIGGTDEETVEIQPMQYLKTVLKVEEQVEEEQMAWRANTSAFHLGPPIIHQFVVQNNGPSPLIGFQVEAWLPLVYEGRESYT
ncbi:integrin alpha-8-like isoform X2 [Portunus trituberculatus]|uniref:integrin alpha-8-like isoform X2 n=1 Tax=Portunus trituberculatus TaxID=210409 RepID=UPI001E1D21F4|nr:integrin alpha-8-like isoform X2 [Portunus trituberculatus]